MADFGLTLASGDGVAIAKVPTPAVERHAPKAESEAKRPPPRPKVLARDA